MSLVVTNNGISVMNELAYPTDRPIGPHWVSLQHSLRPLAGGGGGSPRPPQEPHPLLSPSGFGHTGYAVSCTLGPPNSDTSGP